MSSFSQGGVSTSVISAGLCFAWKHWRFTILILLYCLLDVFIRFAVAGSRHPEEILVANLFQLILGIIGWVGVTHAVSAVDGAVGVGGAMVYGLRRLLVSILAAIPWMVVTLGVSALILIFILGLTRAPLDLAMLLVAMAGGFLNPWSLRLSLAPSILAAKDVPFGGVIGTTWRVSRGQASLIFQSCYLPQLPLIAVNLFLTAVFVGHEPGAEAKLTSGLIALPVSVYMTALFIGSYAALASHLVDASPVDPNDSLLDGP